MERSLLSAVLVLFFSWINATALLSEHVARLARLQMHQSVELLFYFEMSRTNTPARWFCYYSFRELAARFSSRGNKSFKSPAFCHYFSILGGHEQLIPQMIPKVVFHIQTK